MDSKNPTKFQLKVRVDQEELAVKLTNSSIRKLYQAVKKDKSKQRLFIRTLTTDLEKIAKKKSELQIATLNLVADLILELFLLSSNRKQFLHLLNFFQRELKTGGEKIAEIIWATLCSPLAETATTEEKKEKSIGLVIIFAL